MALHTKIHISIGGTVIDTFGELMIYQEVNQHHFFELHCRGDAFMSLGGDIREQFNGKEIFVSISAVGIFSGFKEGKFKGIVNQVVENRSGVTSDNTIIIKGKSPTVLLDSGDHYCSYSEKTMKQIGEEVMQTVQANLLEAEIKPVNKQKLPYIVQYEEGGFEFLSRMARRIGEWCYYTGEKLVFGESKREEIVLNYGKDLSSFSLEANLKPSKVKMMSNDFINNKIVSSATTKAPNNMNGYNQMSLKESESLFMKETTFLNHLAFTEDKYQQELDEAVKIEKAGRTAGMVKVRGKSDNPAVKLGSVINIQEGAQNHGQYIITKVMHQGNGLGDYENSFEGISASAEAPPYVSITSLPLANKQVAVVTDNNDPKGLGRIRVRFPWQDKGEKTPWVRVATPHSGADKGFHFLPELGEEVLIDFEGKNAEKPFMSATFYHGKANPGEWKTDKNNIKAIKTRTGHLIKFDDTNGKESITITDKAGNKIHLSTCENTINISAPNTINISSANINITASEKLDIKAGSESQKMVMDGEGTDMNSTNKISMNGTEKVSIDSNSDVSIVSQGVANLEGKGTLNLKSNGPTTVNGSQVLIN